jgi:hypothetical protein
MVRWFQSEGFDVATMRNAESSNGIMIKMLPSTFAPISFIM